MKEAIIKSIQGGKEILNQISVLQEVGRDYRKERAATIRKINEYHPSMIQLKVVEIIQINKIAKIFRLTSTGGYLPPFQSGQYINIFVEIDGVRTSRPYSLSYTPYQRGFYDITIGRVKDGFVSDYFLDEVKVGDIFDANGPAGHFYHNPIFHGDKLVFLAGGTGITPFIGMLCDILHGGLDKEIHMIYGCRNRDVGINVAILEDLDNQYKNFSFTPVFSESTEEEEGRKGYIDGDLIRELVPQYQEQMYYLCGPGAMYDFCMKELKALGIPGRRICKEVFGAKKEIHQEPAWPEGLPPEKTFNIKIADGKVMKGKAGESILTTLEKEGIRVNVCCRSGQCSLCRIKLVSGKVFSPQGVLRRYADEKYGYIHSCQAYPIEDIEIML